MENFGVQSKRIGTTRSRLGRRILSGLILSAGLAVAADPRLRIEEAQAKKAALEKPAPAYPLTARQLKLSGEVHLDAIVAADGTVEEARIVSGNPILTKPAVEAVRKWRFQPFTVDGTPSRALVALSFEFGAR